MTKIHDDLMAPEVIVDPHTYYRVLRETEPIHFNEKWGGWVLTNYDDVVQVLRDQYRFSSDRMGFLANELSEEQRGGYAPIFEVLSRWFVFADPPFHTRLRLLLNPLFTPKIVGTFRPMVREIVSGLLDDLGPKGRMEVVREFAYQVPMSVILALIGMPDLDREKIKHWSEQIGVFFFIRADEPRRREIACEGVTSMVDYIRPLVEERKKAPGDDIIGVLIRAQQEGGLDDMDVISTIILLIFGGHETTMNLICNGTLALMRHPGEWERLHDDPSIVEKAVEELLRYDGSVKTTVRWAKEDVELKGTTFKKGERLLIALSAANRDPAQFADPDALDLTRDPNAHVAFAHGIHTCIGGPLARMEAQEALLEMTRRLTCPVLETNDLHYVPSVIHRALEIMPVSFKMRGQ
jgi:cytochrome P450